MLYSPTQELERAAHEADEAAELGVAVDPSYLPALQREGFARAPLEPPGTALGGGGGGLLQSSPPSPEFELRAVRASSGLEATVSNGGGSGKAGSGGGGGGSLPTALHKALSGSSGSNGGSMPKARLSPPPEPADLEGSKRHEQLRRHSTSAHTESNLS